MKGTHDSKASHFDFEMLFPRYIPPWKMDAPFVQIMKNDKYLLVAPPIYEGIDVH